MQNIKSLALVLMLGLVGAIYVAGATHDQAQACDMDNKAGCCAAATAASCCKDGAECCKPGAACCKETGGCCKSGSQECKTDGSCCAAHHKTDGSGETSSCCPAGKDGASCCAQGTGCGECCKAS